MAATAPVTQINTGHEEMIHDAQLDYYGKRLATCSSDRTIKIFDAVEGQEPVLKKCLQKHEGPVWRVAWSHPRFGSLLASCGYDAKVIIWKENQQTGEWDVFFEYAHESSINSVSWAPAECGAMLAVGSSDTNITVLMHTGAGEATFKPVKFSAHQMGVCAVAFAPTAPMDGDNGRKPRMASGGCDNAVKIWTSSNNSTTWDERKIGEHEGWVRDVAFAANIGTPRNVLASASADGTCKIFVDDKGDMADWTVADTLRPGKSEVWCVSWSVSGQILAVTTADAAVTLYKEDLQGKWNAVTDITDQGATPRSQ